MRKIFVADLLNEITRYLLGKNNFYRINITDFQCQGEENQILVDKEDRKLKNVICDLTAKDKYTELYDKLVIAYKGRIELVVTHSFEGEYMADCIIDKKVHVSFKYRTS